MRKRVLEVIRQGQIGGGESHLLDLVDLMSKEEVEPVVLSFTTGEMVRRLTAMGIRCHVIESLRAFDLRVTRQVEQLLRDEHIDMVHAHGSRAASNMLMPARRLHLPLLYTVHGWSFHDDQSPVVFRLRAWSERLLCRQATAVICVSQSNADTGLRRCGLREAVVIENGVNLRRFDAQAVPTVLRTTLGFGQDDVVAGFVGRCTKQKSPLDFLAAVAKAHGRDERVKALFVGEGDMDAEVDAYIRSQQMESYVCRQPFRTDVPELLQAMDIYCLPSLWEGLSIGLLEAMAMGKAVVATPTDGTREVIRHEENGLTVPFGDADGLCQAILRLAADAALRQRCGQAAVSLVCQRFNAQTTADRTLQVYRKILKR